MVKCLCVCKSHLFPLAGCVRQRTEINQTNLGVAGDVSNVSKTATICTKESKAGSWEGEAGNVSFSKKNQEFTFMLELHLI